MYFVSIAVQLKHEPMRTLSIADARLAHGAVMHAISRRDTQAGQVLHDIQRCKPMTISILSPKRTSAILRLTFLNPAGIDYANLLMSDWLSNPSIHLGNLACEIDGVEASLHPWSGVQSWETLANQKPSGRPFTLEFHTPTAINKVDDQNKRFTSLFPDPLTIFTGLLKKWKQLGGPALHGDLTSFIQTGGCVVSSYRLETITFELPGYKQKGFRGRATYEIRKNDHDCSNSIFSLARFAFYSGIGYHTAQGMGAVRIQDGNDA